MKFDKTELKLGFVLILKLAEIKEKGKIETGSVFLLILKLAKLNEVW